MATVNLEIGLKGGEALKKLQAEVASLRAELDKLDTTTGKASKTESGLAAYRKEQIKEMRNYRFVVNEVKDAVGAGTIALNLLALGEGNANSSLKDLTKTVDTAFIAFQGMDAITSVFGKSLDKLGGKIGLAGGQLGLIISIGAAVAGIFASMTTESEKSKTATKELNDELDRLFSATPELKAIKSITELNEAENKLAKDRKTNAENKPIGDSRTLGISLIESAASAIGDALGFDKSITNNDIIAEEKSVVRLKIIRNNLNSEIESGKRSHEIEMQRLSLESEELQKLSVTTSLEGQLRIRNEYQKKYEELAKQSKIEQTYSNEITRLENYLIGHQIELPEIDISKPEEALKSLNDIAFKAFLNASQDSTAAGQKRLVELKTVTSNVDTIVKNAETKITNIREESNAKRKKLNIQYGIDEKSFHMDMLKSLSEQAEKEKQILQDKNRAITEINYLTFDAERNITNESNALFINNLNSKLTAEMNYALASNEIAKNRAISKAAESGKSVEEINAIEQQYDVKAQGIRESSNNKRILNEQEANNKIKSLKVAIMDSGVEKTKAALDLEMNAEIKFAQESIANTIQFEETKALIEEKYRKAKEQAEIESYKKIGDLTSQMLGYYSEFYSMSNSLSINSMNSRIDNLESEKEAALQVLSDELENENITADERIAIQKRQKEVEAGFNEEIKAAKNEVWEAEKEAKKGQALISGAQAIITALGGAPPPFNAILAAITAGLVAKQMTVIDAQQPPKFHTGGIVGQDALRPDERLIVGQVGETIRTKKQESELNQRSGVANVYLTFNAPVDKVEYVKQAIQEGLKQSNLTITEYAVNQSSKVLL